MRPFVTDSEQVKNLDVNVGVDVEPRLREIFAAPFLVDGDNPFPLPVGEAVPVLEGLDTCLEDTEVGIKVVEDRLKFPRMVFRVPLLPCCIFGSWLKLPHGKYREVE